MNFNLSEYSKSMRQLLVFDVLIKEEVVNKDAFLSDLIISPTSYRRAKIKEQNVGNEIVLKLAKHFKIRLVSEKYIKRLEKLISKIYLDINYRVTDRHEQYLEELSNLDKEVTVLFPIVKLFKLFVVTFSNKNVPDIIDEYFDDFLYVSQFESFYNSDLLEIYDLLKLTFSSTLTKEMLAKQYSNGIAYSIIAGKQYFKKQYFESLFFAQKAKELFLRENNYKRCISINFTILNNFASNGTFDDFYSLAKEQFQTVRSFDVNSPEMLVSRKVMIISALSVNKFEEVFELVEDINNIRLTELFCYIIAKFNSLNSKLFDEWYFQYINKLIIKDKYKESCNVLVDYLRKPEKGKISVLEECKVMQSLIEVIKWL